MERLATASLQLGAGRSPHISLITVNVCLMHLSMLSSWGRGGGGGGEGRPGIVGGFNSSHRPVVGTFDRFNGLSSNILLFFSCYFDNPQMPWGGAFEKKLSAQFKCLPMPGFPPPPPPPSSLTLIGALYN